jgi:hypothetical protein
MSCQNCKSARNLNVTAKCSDFCIVIVNGHEHVGSVPDDLSIGNGDYIKFDLCLDCGQIQGKFPLKKSTLEESEQEES